MEKLKTSKEVLEVTGLSRKQLFKYKDVVAPTKYMQNDHSYTTKTGKRINSLGYGLYDCLAVEKLRIVSLLIEFGFEHHEIKSISNNEFKVCLNDIKCLKERTVKDYEILSRRLNLISLLEDSTKEKNYLSEKQLKDLILDGGKENEKK